MTPRRTAPHLLVVAGVAALLVASACGSDDTTVADGPGLGDRGDEGDDSVDLLGFTPARSEAITGPLYLLPVDLELADAEVTSTRVISAAEVDVGSSGSAVALGVPTDTGARDLVLVGIEDVENDREVSESEQRDLTYADVGGVEARVGQSLLGATVDWFVDGRLVFVVAAPGADERALAVARALEPAADGPAAIPAVPDGLTVLASATLTPETIDDVRPALARWTATIRVGASRLSVEAASSPIDFAPITSAMPAGELHTVDVRNATGAWSSRTTSDEGTDDVGIITSTTATLAWLEHPGYGITISGDADLDTLVMVAESLDPVDRDTFEKYTPELRAAASSTSLP